MKPKKESAMRKQFADQRLEPDQVDASVLDAVPFMYAGRTLDICMQTEEFTHICPMTGLPDFGELTIEYIPNQSIIELKSLKYYLLQYRNVGIFYEHVIFRVLDDLVNAVKPESMQVTYDVGSRGGIHSSVQARWPE